jgi:hypothetical protein
MINNYVFEIMDEFKYLGSTVNNSNNVSNEIRFRIMVGNKCYFSLINLLKSKNISRVAKCKLYRTVIWPVLTYGAETWAINKSDERKLMTLERKMLRKTFGPVTEDNQWRIRTNSELEELYTDINIGIFIKLQRLRWMGHLHRMDDARNAKKIYKTNLHQKGPKGRPKARWKDEVENDIRKMRIDNWRQIVQDRDGWRTATRGALILLG